jgi:hypothetical protein
MDSGLRQNDNGVRDSLLRNPALRGKVGAPVQTKTTKH